MKQKHYEEELRKFKERCEHQGCHRNLRKSIFSNWGMIEFAKFILKKETIRGKRK